MEDLAYKFYNYTRGMLWEILLAIFSGVNAGVLTGLIPGIHVNLISALLVSASSTLLNHISPLTLCCFIISMALTHTFVDAIPSIFLGAPDSAMILNVLPGHKMLMQGRGYEAVALTVIGSLTTLILIVLLFPLLLKSVPSLHTLLTPHIGLILIFVSISMILMEKRITKIIVATTIFCITGLLGHIILNGNFTEPLMPLLSGLFGIPTLLLSLKDKNKIARQRRERNIDTTATTIATTGVVASITGAIAGVLPGLGSAHSSIIAMQILRTNSAYTMLMVVGGINTANFLVSIATVYTLSKARNGAIIAVKSIIETITTQQLLTFISCALIVGGCATTATLYLARTCSHLIEKINYQKLVIIILIVIALVAYLLSGWQGIIILVTASAIGILPPTLNVKRSHAMGCLLVPIIMYFI